MHINDGQLKATLTQEELPDQERVRQHLTDCPLCQRQADLISTQSEQVASHLDSLAPVPGEAVHSIESARARLHVRIKEKEKISMNQNLFSRTYRPAWAVLGMVLLLVIAFSFPGVRTLASSFLGLFRVEQITFVSVNPNNASEIADKLGSSELFQTLFSKDIKVEPIGKNQVVSDAAEAGTLASIPVRLPTGLTSPARLEVQQGTRMTFSVDLPKVREILKEIGRMDIQLPDDIDGSIITLQLPVAVTANFGDCKRLAATAGIGNDPTDPDDGGLPWLPGCTQLVQVSTPTISAPPGLDIAKIGEAFLQLLGMSTEEAAQISQTVDWTTTLVVPVPTYFDATYRDVLVDGVTGTLITQNQTTQDGTTYNHITLLWVKNGVLYALSGPGNIQDVLAVANSLN